MRYIIGVKDTGVEVTCDTFDELVDCLRNYKRYPTEWITIRTEPDVPAAAVEWNHEKNARRCDLIDKQLDETITAEEAWELTKLQDEMLEFRRRYEPVIIPRDSEMTGLLLSAAIEELAAHPPCRNRGQIIGGLVLRLKQKGVIS